MRIGVVTFLLANAILLGGCPPTPPEPAAPHVGPYQANRAAGEAADMNSVVMLSPTVAAAIGVQKTVGYRGETGGLECVARLLNRTQGPAEVQARAVFYDEHQMPLGDETVVQRISFKPLGEGMVKFTSTSTRAAYYVIEIGEVQ